MEVEFYLLQLLKNWWWILFPWIFYFSAKFFYFWWMNWEVFYKKAFKWILLEIKPPKEVLKPFSGMESVLSMMWGIFDAPNWRERWCEGELVLGGGGWFSFEICSFGGEIHFYLRIPDSFKNQAETALYSQYPDAEIFEVEDYTQKVPRDIPNEKWYVSAEDYVLAQPDYYPIKTYSMFFEKPEEEKRIVEEKRLDPLDALLEGLSKFLPGEQMWIQIVCNPIVEDTFPWQKEGRRAADKIARRVPPKPPKSILETATKELISVPITLSTSKKPKKEQVSQLELIAPELRLTPLEREILTAIENKLKKPAYECWIRAVYVAKKDEPHLPENRRIVRGYFTGQFTAPHLNRFVYFGATRVRIHYWFRNRRLFLRKRQRFREYIERLPSFFPWNIKGEAPPLLKLIRYRLAPGRRSVCVLNVEELATIFHLPIKVYLPTIPRVEVKKVGPPPTLPEK